MRKTAIFVLLLAVALGGVTVYLARDYLERQVQQTSLAQPAAPAIALTTVVVARRPLNFGDSLTKEHIREVEWPAAMLPQGAYKTVDEIFVEGERRVVLRAIQVNEPVLASKLSGAGGRATLSTIIDDDMRAVTIRVNDVNGVAGFVLPGDRVDILLTRNEGNSNKNPITDVLLQHVKVMGIDQKASEEQDKPVVARAVTLEVSQYDSQKLALASTVGSLSLALRNEANNEQSWTKTVRISDLKGNPPPVKVETVSVETAGEGTPRKKTKVVRVAPVSNFTKVTVVRGVSSSTESVLKDKKGADVQAASAATQTGSTSNSKAAGSAEELEPVRKGPKILVPQG